MEISDKYPKISSTKLRKQIANSTYTNKKDEIDKRVLKYILENNLYLLKENNKCFKKEFYDNFYIFIGKLATKNLLMPKFNSQLSRNAWKNQFYKYYYDNKLNENNCFRTYTDYASCE